VILLTGDFPSRFKSSSICYAYLLVERTRIFGDQMRRRDWHAWYVCPKLERKPATLSLKPSDKLV
jgi:hypothetical protein